MAITALNKIAPAWYTPACEKDSTNPTRFKLRPLTPPEKESVTEFDGKQFVIPPKNYSQVLRMGITDWENFTDESGRPVKCASSNHDRIPEDIRIELAVEILTRSQLSEDERKNSE